MSLVKLFCQTVGYKTVRSFLVILLIFVVLANFLFICSTRFQMQPRPSFDSYFWLSRHSNMKAHLLPRLFPQNDGLNKKHQLKKAEEQSNLSHAVVDVASTLGTFRDCVAWCCRGDGVSPPYNLSAVLLVRIYRHDPARLSSREMLQWLYYLRFAGFEHVYVYDAYVTKNESQYDVLNPLVQSGYVTYEDWSIHNPYTLKGTQIAAYRHCAEKYGEEFKWQAAMDIDEYPFSPIDQKENFMQRFLQSYALKHPGVSQITLPNYLFLGKPLNDQTNPLLVDRIRRRTLKPANQLGKSIYKSADLLAPQVHHHDMRNGKSVDCDARQLRLNHYWGARLQDWGEDTPKILRITESDFTIKPIIDEINRCSKCLGEDNLYVRRWN